MIARLQMSDLHLGDPRSVLSNPEVASAAVRQIKELSGGRIGKLVLAGDAWEECVPAGMISVCEGLAVSVHQAAADFFGTLFREVVVDEVVWVPGNHDLSTWYWYCRSKSLPTVTGYAGREVDRHDWPWAVFLPGFGGKLTVSYPIYWDCRPGTDYPMLVTTHGHLLDKLVLGWEADEKYLALKSLNCARPNVPRTSEGVGSMKKLADATLDFILSLWRRYSPRDYTYANSIMRRLDHPQSCGWQPIFPHDGAFKLDEHMIASDSPLPGQGHTAQLPWLLEVLIMDPYLPTPVGSLRPAERVAAFDQLSCLTFGHDHLGFYRNVVACGVPFACADSGGWTSEWDGHMPHTHVLVWEKPDQVVPVPYFVRVRTKDGKVL